MRFLPKWFFFFVLVASGYLLVAARPTFAQTTELASPTGESIPNNLHNYTQQVLLDLSSALTCQLVGIDPTGPNPVTGEAKKCLGYDLTGKLGFIENPAPNGAGQVGGAIGVMGNLIAVLYTPPASSGEYFRYLADNFGIVKPAYAQAGIGFEGLKPLLGVWTVLRNVAYLVLVLVFVVVGVMVMLRVKIDPRTVMSIQNQIPRILITLIFVTFSYAIAGFLIDMMYVVIYFFINLLAPLSPEITEITKSLQGQTVIGFANDIPFKGLGDTSGLLGIITATSGMFGSLIASLFSGEIGTIIGAILGGAIGATAGIVVPGIGNIVGAVLGTILGGTAGGILGPTLLGTLGSIIAFLIIAIAVLWALFRLWFQLLMAYINILIDVAFAPLWILVGALPGVGLGFTSWLKDMLANLVAFPVTIGMFLLGKIFMEGFRQPIQPDQPTPFVPPLIGNPNNTEALGALIGLGIILLTPQVVNMIRDAFKAPPFKYAFAIGQALGAGGGIIGGTARGTAGAAFVATHGTFPKPGEDRGIGAIFRRFLR